MTADQTNEDGNVTVKRKPSLVAYMVREGKEDQSFWTPVGAAWSNRNGGFTLQLYAMPMDGHLVLNPPSAKAK